MITDLTALDFSQFSTEQLTVAKDRIRDIELQKIKNQLEKNAGAIEKSVAKIIEQEKVITDVDERLKEQEKLTNVIGFSVHSRKFKSFRAACTSRVYQLLEGTGNIYFSLWSPFLFKKIYGEIASYFDVDTCKNIHVDSYNQALKLSLSWSPSDHYILSKTEELIKKRDTGQLKQERVVALSVFLKETDNGHKNPFRKS